MRLLKSPKEIDRTIKRLIESYQHYDWMCAWAGIKFASYQALITHQSRCRNVVIGTHFFQTHPEFISSLMKNTGVRFIKRPNELFHPKSYLFYNNSDDWQLLIGSANFTKAAFSSNTELILWISSKDSGSDSVLKDYQLIIDDCWKKASSFTDLELAKYKRAWQNAKPKKESLARDYGSTTLDKTNPLEIQVQTMTWDEYVTRLLKSRTDVQMRIDLLAHIHLQFLTFQSFRQMPVEMRKFIAGVQNSYDSGLVGEYDPWMAFGNMSGSGYFANRVIENDRGIWEAVDSLPLTGQVTRDDYARFVEHFTKTFSEKSVATATRLLAMKRPDIFYCLTSANKRKFSSEFSLTCSHIDLNTYWDLVVMPIQDSEWWLHAKPKGRLHSEIKENRAAFLDSLYYQE